MIQNNKAKVKSKNEYFYENFILFIKPLNSSLDWRRRSAKVKSRNEGSVLIRTPPSPGRQGMKRYFFNNFEEISGNTPTTAISTPTTAISTPSTAISTPTTAISSPTTAISTPSPASSIPSPAISTSSPAGSNGAGLRREPGDFFHHVV